MKKEALEKNATNVPSKKNDAFQDDWLSIMVGEGFVLDLGASFSLDIKLQSHKLPSYKIVLDEKDDNVPSSWISKQTALTATS